LKKRLEIYTDGGVYSDLNLVKWAFIVVENNEDMIYSESGDLNGGGEHNFDVERAESEAIFNALNWVRNNSGNYFLFTDSKSVLEKIRRKSWVHTKNPRIPGICNILEEIKNSPLPISVNLSYCKRRSNIWMKKVDDLCYKDCGK
jgi:ribonuclease HI